MERHPILRHRIGGGWAPDFGLVAEAVGGEAQVLVPWLAKAENIEFLLDGSFRKMGGTTRLNASALESGAAVMGLVDYWRQGTSGSPTQKRVIHVGTKIKKDDADGNFTDIGTGFVSGAIPDYAIFDDDLIIMSDAAADVPRVWDQTTLSTLGTNTPNGAFGVAHQNRFWIAGVDANPSTLYYSQALPNGAGGDWNGTGAGSITIESDDGDRITGLASYKDELWVFKGPYRGSIHRITGSSPADFARRIFVKGIGAVNHNGIFTFLDDLGFVWSDGNIYSLQATAAFGDYREAALSLPLNQWLRENVRQDVLEKCWAANFPSKGCVLITLPVFTSTDNNYVLCMDYRFTQVEGAPRWSARTAYNLACIAPVADEAATERPAIYAGGDDGFVRKLDQSNRSIDSGASGYRAWVQYPYLHYGEPERMKVLGNALVSMVPRDDSQFRLTWRRDKETEQFVEIQQVGISADTLAPSASPFTLGTSVLGTEEVLDQRAVNIEEGGEFRAIQWGFIQGGAGEDMEIHGLATAIEPSALSWEGEVA